MGIITNMVLKNPRLKKLLYYTTPDCLSRPGVEDKDAYAMFGKNIKIIPKMQFITKPPRSVRGGLSNSFVNRRQATSRQDKRPCHSRDRHTRR